MFGKRGDTVGVGSSPTGSDFIEKKVDALQEKILTSEKLQSQVFDFMAEFELRVGEIVDKKLKDAPLKANASQSPDELKDQVHILIKEVISEQKTGEITEESITRKLDDLGVDFESKLNKALNPLTEQIDTNKNELMDLKASFEGLSQDGASKEIGEIREKLQNLMTEARQVLDSAKGKSTPLTATTAINTDQLKSEISAKFDGALEQLRAQIESNSQAVIALKSTPAANIDSAFKEAIDETNRQTEIAIESTKGIYAKWVDELNTKLNKTVDQLQKQIDANAGSVSRLGVDDKISGLKADLQYSIRELSKTVSSDKSSKAIELLKKQMQETDEKVAKLKEALKIVPKPDPKLGEFKEKIEALAKDTKLALKELRNTKTGKTLTEVTARVKEIEKSVKKKLDEAIGEHEERLTELRENVEAGKNEVEKKTNDKLAVAVEKLETQIQQGLARIKMPEAIAEELKKRLEEEITEAIAQTIKPKDMDEFEMKLMSKINTAMDLLNRQIDRHDSHLIDLRDQMGSLIQSENKTESQVAPAINDLKSFKLTMDQKFKDMAGQLESHSSGLATHDYVAILETEFRKKLARVNSRLNAFEVEGFGGSKQPVPSREAEELRKQLKDQIEKISEIEKGLMQVRDQRASLNKMGADMAKLRDDFTALNSKTVQSDLVGNQVNELNKRMENLFKNQKENRKLIDELKNLKDEVYEVAGSSVRIEQLESIKKFIREFNVKEDALANTVTKLDEKLTAIVNDQKKIATGKDIENLKSRVNGLAAKPDETVKREVEALKVAVGLLEKDAIKSSQIDAMRKEFSISQGKDEIQLVKKEIEDIWAQFSEFAKGAARIEQVEAIKNEFCANEKPRANPEIAKQRKDIEALQANLGELSKSMVKPEQLDAIKKGFQDYHSKVEVAKKTSNPGAELAKQKKDIDTLRRAIIQLDGETVKVEQMEGIKKYLTDFNARAEDFSKNLSKIKAGVGNGASPQIAEEISKQKKQIEDLKASLNSQVFTDELKGLSLRINQLQDAVKQLKNPENKEMEIIKKAVKAIAVENGELKRSWSQEREKLFVEMKAFAKSINERVGEIEISKPDKTGFSHVRKSVERLVGEIEAFEKRADEERKGMVLQLAMFKEFTEKTNKRVDDISQHIKKISDSKENTEEIVKKNFNELNSQLNSFKGYSLEQIGKINEWIGFIKENLK